MAGVGVGGLLTGLFGGNPEAQLAQSLAGPRPNPQAQPGQQDQGQAQAAPGAAPPQMAPSPAYAPDPVSMSMQQALLNVHRNEQLSNDINRNMMMIGGAFGTADQQRNMTQLAMNQGGGGGDTLGALGEIQKIQEGQFKLQNEQRFQASADLLWQALGGKPGVGAAASSDLPLFRAMIDHKMSDTDKTTQMKNIDAFEASARAAHMPEADIQRTKMLALTGAITPGLTTDEKEMNRDIQLWQADPANKGKSYEQMIKEKPGFASLEAYKATSGATAVEAKAEQKYKFDAHAALPVIKSSLDPVSNNIKSLFGPDGKVLPEVITAIQSGDAPDEGWMGSLSGTASRYGAGNVFSSLDPNIMDKKIILSNLRSQLTGNVLKDVKNVRNIREFETLGAGATPLFKKSASAEEIQSSAENLLKKFNTAEANAIAAAGGELTPEQAKLADSQFLDRNNPLYNEAKVIKGGGDEKPVVTGGGGTPLNADQTARLRAAIAAHPHDREKILSTAKSNGFDVSGF